MTLPYVDQLTFSRAPTGLDLNQLLVGGTAQDQAAELTNVLLRASRWVDTITRQRNGLAATTNQDPPRRIKATLDGTLQVFPLTFPIVSVVAAQWWWVYPGTVPTVNSVNTEMVTILDRSFVIADQYYGRSRGWGARTLMVQYQYENGYAHTELTDSAAEGATTITVDSTIGMTGTSSALAASVTPYLTILDGNQREDIVVQSISGNVLTLQAGLTYSHDDGVIVTGIPYDVQQSTIDLAAYLVKTRDAGSIEMNESGFGQHQSAKGLAEGQGFDATMKRLHPYRRLGAG